MQDGAILLWVVLGLLLPAATLCCFPAFQSLGPVDRWGAPAPATAAYADPHLCIFLCWGVGPAGSFLGPSTAAPNGSSFPAAGLQADLDLSEPGLAYGGSTQQTGAAHIDPLPNNNDNYTPPL